MVEIPSSTVGKLSLIAQGRTVAEGASQLLTATLDAPDYLKTLKNLSAKQEYIDGLYKIVCTLSPDSDIYKRGLRALRKAGGVTNLLPTCYHISPPLKEQDEMATASGGSSDVWKAQNQEGVVFALKVFRMNKQSNLAKSKKGFCKEVVIAKRVQHENVLPILGVQMTGSKLSIVSEWLGHGDMHAYLNNNKNVTIDRVDLLLGVTRGLDYLHSIDVVHGDLKSPNILIDKSGRPRLTDFGFSSITRNVNSVNVSTPGGRGTLRWCAPELLVLSTKEEDQRKVLSVRPTRKSDSYSFAMVVIEIFTGEHPFDSWNDQQVTLLLSQGTRPGRPEHEQFTPKMWSLTRKCWKQNPKKRPDIEEVLRKLTSSHGEKLQGLFPVSFGALLGSRVSLRPRKD